MEFHQSDKLNWQEQFKTMKRWYYRLRGDNSIFSSPKLYQEDFFVAFFVSSYHFKEWLKKEKIATQAQIDKHFKENECLRLADAIANLAKHKTITIKEYKDNTRIVGQKYLYGKSGGPIYMISRLKVESKGRIYHDTFQIVDRCMDAWGQFIISKNLEIPDMPEEYLYSKLVKWEPKSL